MATNSVGCEAIESIGVQPIAMIEKTVAQHAKHLTAPTDFMKQASKRRLIMVNNAIQTILFSDRNITLV